MAFLNLRGHLGVFVSAHEIPFPGNGDFGSKRRSSNPQLLSGKTGGPRRRKVAAHQDFRSTTTTLSRRSRSSGTTTAKPDGHTRRKRRSATVFTSNEMPSLTSTRILSLQPSRHFCRSLMVVGSYRSAFVGPPLRLAPVAGRHLIRTMHRAGSEVVTVSQTGSKVSATLGDGSVVLQQADD